MDNLHFFMLNIILKVIFCAFIRIRGRQLTDQVIDICDECAKTGKKIYRCGKCGASLCIHSVRIHKCERSVYKGKPKVSEGDKNISKAFWKEMLKTEKKFEIVIQSDLTFYVDYPYHPFTELSAWIPVRRNSYKTESSTTSFNAEEMFEHLAKDTENNYHRKFYYDSTKRSWAGDEFYVWFTQWKRMSRPYWDRPSNKRKTKFSLEFPQLAYEDIKLLEKSGCTVTYEDGAKEKIDRAIKTALSKFVVEVEARERNFIIRWSEDFNKWFYTFLEVFLRYMAIKEEEDSDEYISCIKQVGPREIEVAYWAEFRANYFWYKLSEFLKETDIPLFNLKYLPYERKSAHWPTGEQPQATYKLRPYQQEAIDLWLNDNMFGTIQLPTGAGKTLIGIEAIRVTNERTLILVPNLALVDQWVEQISNMLAVPVSVIGVFNGQRKEFRNHPVVVSTYQLLSQYLQDFLAKSDSDVVSRRDQDLVDDTIGLFNNKFGLIITDEAHHIQAETFRLIAMNLQIPRRLSLSATVEESQHSSLVIGIMGPIVFNIGYGSLSQDGFIAPLCFTRIAIPLTQEEKKELKEKNNSLSAQGKITRSSTNKFNALLKIVESKLTEQILIYTSRVTHAKKIYTFLKKNNIDSRVITGEIEAKELTSVLEKFKSKKINILILVKMLNEGFDAPADTIIITSGSRNKREQIQRVGRATRPGKVAKLFELVIDGNDLEYEIDIAKARDISNIINPSIQEKLFPDGFNKEIKKLIKDLEAVYVQ